MTPQENLIQILSPYLEKWKEMTRPFVWRLMIAYEDFKTALGVVESSLTDPGQFRAFMEKPEYADSLLIMTGEWYKRCYTGEGSRPEWIKRIDFESLWKNTSLRFPQKWVYKFDGGYNSWQYSSFVLGGLACSWRQEDLIKTLLEFFNGENEDEINTDDLDEGAVALRRSIEERGSIYHFFKELINPESKVRKFYDADCQPDVREFSSRIDFEVKHVAENKMTLEWRYIATQTYSNEIYKTLQLKIHPENYNDKPTYFVSLDKIKAWGFTDVDQIAEVELSIRFFYRGRKASGEINVARLLTTGKSSAGFIIEDLSSGLLPALPYEFDRWEIVGKTGSQSKVLFQNKDEILPFDAVYQMASDPGAWSTRWRRGRAAVIFNDNCSIIDPLNHPVVGKRLIVNENGGRPVYWADIPVYVMVRYRDSKGDEHTQKIENPLAEAEVTITQKPFINLFEYFDTNKVKVIEKDPHTGEETVSYLPLLYGTDGLALKVSADRRNHTLLENTGNNKVLEIGYRQGGSPLEESELKEGITEIKVKGEGQSAEIRVWLIPKKENHDTPAVRDLKTEKIKWFDKKSKHIEAEDTDILEIYERKGEKKNESAKFPVYRPWNRKEIFMNKERVACLENNEPLQVGLLNLRDISVRIFDENGYREWSGDYNIGAFNELAQKRMSASVDVMDGKIRVHNWLNNLRSENPMKLGNVTMTPDPEHKLVLIPNVEFESSGDWMVDTTEPLEAYESLINAIGLNIYSMCFDSLANLSKENLIELFNKIREEKGEKFLKDKIKATKRILWEKGLELNDINLY